MEIKFADGEAGFFEATALETIARYALDCDPVDGNEIQVIDTLRAAGDQHAQRVEYAGLRDSAERDPVATVTAGPRDGIWRILFGPSRRELRLSEQRSAALGRAERAEQALFDALAETARIARERDLALEQVAALERSLNSARKGGA